MGNCVKKTKETTILSHTFRLQAPMQTLAEEREEILNFRVDIFRWKIRGFPRVGGDLGHILPESLVDSLRVRD